jgi:hypothetical protein
MFSPLRRFILTLLSLSLLCLMTTVGPGAAQEGGQVRLAPPETAAYPQISTYLEVRDGQGDFVHGLQKGDVIILEDGDRIPVTKLDALRSGVQLVVAVNPGPAFAIRNIQGESRFDFLKQYLLSWGDARLGSTMDDLSLLANDNPDATHLAEVKDWIASVEAYQPDARNAVPGPDILARAVDVAADSAVRPGMPKVVLFITAPMEPEAGIGLQSIASRAEQMRVRLLIWLVASTERFSSQEANQLKDLARQTDGGYFAYSGLEEIPDLEDYLEPLRNTYLLEYDSRINTSGPHQLAAQVNLGGSTVTSNQQEFNLEVLPPNVAFISPHLQIERIHPPEEQDAQVLIPQSQRLEVLIEFPDGHQRSIQRATLYVDGEIADEKTESPFDQFRWDLSEYTNTAQHTLRVEVVDSLGLSGMSMDTPVLVSVKYPPQNILVTFSRNLSLLAGATVILAGAILMLVLIRGGQIRPGILLNWRRRRRRSDPVTQPVKVKRERGIRPRSSWINRLNWTQRRLASQAVAFLTPITESGKDNSSPPISIALDEITFGSDPSQVSQVVDDPSVEGAHARLQRKKDGEFCLSDLGSVAGTWINYTPVSKEGSVLEHGDLIHIGRVGFRFTLRNPGRVRKPVIIPQGPKS